MVFQFSKMMGNKTEETPQPITDDALPTSSDNGVTNSNTLNIDQNNVVNMDNTQATPVAPKVQQTQKPQAQPQTQTAAPAVKTTKAGPTSFLEVKNLPGKFRITFHIIQTSNSISSQQVKV